MNKNIILCIMFSTLLVLGIMTGQSYPYILTLKENMTLKEKNMEKEVWKDVNGFESFYQVSSLGRIKRLERYTINKIGIKNLLKEKIIKPGKSKTGYLHGVFTKNKKRINFRVHRIVAIAFILNPENKLYVNHINGIKSDNRVINLEWCTHAENEKHASKNGLKAIGERNSNTPFIKEDIIKIRQLYKTGKYYQREIAKMFNVSQCAINNIILRKSWKHI